jgi:hypothetical protein
MEIELDPHLASGGSTRRTSSGWRLEIPAGRPRTFRLAQLDDYSHLARRHFFHTMPVTVRLRARLSGADLPGTWGFGFWNDPFGLSIGFGGNPVRLPALPQTAWFMHASWPNWLSFQEESANTPANGFFAGIYRSPRLPSLLFLPGLLASPLLVIRPISRFLRRLASRIIRHEAVPVSMDVTAWHEYSIEWLCDTCVFYVDGVAILKTSCSPRPPLGLVLWIDNQFANWTPKGRLGYGTLENSNAWIEIDELNFLQD